MLKTRIEAYQIEQEKQRIYKKHLKDLKERIKQNSEF